MPNNNGTATWHQTAAESFARWELEVHGAVLATIHPLAAKKPDGSNYIAYYPGQPSKRTYHPTLEMAQQVARGVVIAHLYLQVAQLTDMARMEQEQEQAA